MMEFVIFVIFLSYRLLTYVLHGILDMYSKVLSVLDPNRKENCCELLQILYRQTIFLNDLTIPKVNFLWIHKSFGTADLLKSPYWSLYGIDETHVYFVKLAKPVEEYNVRNAPFFFGPQITEGTEIARMTLEKFCQYGQQVGPPLGPVVYLTSAPRSGSTLLSQMLQAAEDWVVLAEPDVFVELRLLNSQGHFTKSLYESLIRACFNVLCKNQQSHQTYVVKVATMIPDVIWLLPQVKHLFLWRRNTSKCINSIVRAMKGLNAGLTYKYIPFHFQKFMPWRDCLGYTRAEPDIAHIVKPRDNIEASYIAYAVPYSVYHKAKELTKIFYVEYENLLAKPEEELNKIFQHFNISQKFVANALECLNKDSQVNTLLGREKIGNIRVSDVMTDERKVRYKEIDQLLGLGDICFRQYD